MTDSVTLGTVRPGDTPAPGRALAREGAPSVTHSEHPHLRPRDTADVAEAVRAATAQGVALRIAAGGSWTDAGRPSRRATQPLEVGAIRGIIEYVPGDLTLTARAGTTLAEIDDATRPHGQWLPLDPHGSIDSTLGATLATASFGPLASYNGFPRDLTLGVEFVDGRGVVVRGGGRVVKNVAGFDLVRLTIGAWGTLGVITEVSVRLRARPAVEVTLAVDLPRNPDTLSPFLRALREAPLSPLAMELVDGALARGLGLGDDDLVLLRLAGNKSAISAQRRHVESLGLSRAVGSDTWSLLRASLPASAWTARLSRRPSMLATLWHECSARAIGIPGAYRTASVDRGIARLVVPAEGAAAVGGSLAMLAERWHVVGERLPLDAWRSFAPVANDRLSANIRNAFDPLHLLNPGLLAAEPVA